MIRWLLAAIPALTIALGSVLFTTSVRAQPITAELAVVTSAAGGLQRNLVLRLKDDQGDPLRGAVVEVSVDMPSMPMAHRVPKAPATPTEEPGTYIASITFEMKGQWAAKIEVLQPVQQTVVRKFVIQ